MFTTRYIHDALERAIVTMSSTAVSLITLNVPFQALDWGQIVSMAGVSGVVSILTSVSALGFGEENSASFLSKAPGSGNYGKHSQ